MSDQSKEHTSGKSLLFGLALNTTYTIIEFAMGFITGSLALIADASHNLTDTFTLTVSLFANRYARKKADDKRSFGYGRATILAALLNGVVMLGIAGLIIYEAIKRLIHPEPVSGGIIAIVASIGIFVNGIIALRLYKNRSDLNMRSAFIDMAFDAVSSMGAVIAGLVILLTKVTWIDSAVGLGIAGLLIFNTVKILKEAINILLEGVPLHLDPNEIQEAIESADNVEAVDDLHIWTIRSGYTALSCHISVIELNLDRSNAIVANVKKTLQDRYAINHTTIEVETESQRQRSSHEAH